MKKKMFINLSAMFVVFAFATQSFAITGTKTFTLSATVPAATGIVINASKVDSTSNVFTLLTGTALSFNPMTFNATNSIYLPGHYFAIDVGSVGGAGVPSVTVTYTEGTNPNTPGHGLGWKSMATFVKIVGTTETQLSAHGPKKLLKDVSNEQISFTEIVGGFLRIYVGIVPGGTGLPAGAEPFTNSDKPGTYEGTLFISATVV